MFSFQSVLQGIFLIIMDTLGDQYLSLLARQKGFDADHTWGALRLETMCWPQTTKMVL